MSASGDANRSSKAINPTAFTILQIVATQQLHPDRNKAAILNRLHYDRLMRWILLIMLHLPATLIHAAPATQPSVLVMKFEQVDQTPGFAWLSRAMQQSLAADIHRTRMLRAITLPEARSTPTTDPAVGLNLATEQRADFVIVGAYQVWNETLRITAQVIDVKRGDVIGSLKSTGEIRNLFLLQDGLIAQLRPMFMTHDKPVSAVSSAQLEIPRTRPVGIAMTINHHEMVHAQPWRSSAMNRHTFIGVPDNHFWWGGWRSYGYGLRHLPVW